MFGSYFLHSLFEFVSFRIVSYLHSFRIGPFHIVCIRYISCRFGSIICIRFGSFWLVRSFRSVWFRFNIHLDVVLYDSNKFKSIQSKYYLHIVRFDSKRFVLFALVRVRVSIVCIRLLVPAV